MTNTNELVALRARKGYTQTDVAKRLGITVQSYCAKETNKPIIIGKNKKQYISRFTLSEALKLCEMLDVEAIEQFKLVFGNAFKEVECVVKMGKMFGVNSFKKLNEVFGKGE